MPRIASSVAGVRVDLHDTGVDRDERLRSAVAEFRGIELSQVVIARLCQRCGSTGHGQPTADGVRVTRSRSGQFELTAVVADEDGVRIGVDLEQVDRFTGDEVDGVLLHPTEVDAVASAEHRAALRAELWTAKEALLKAVGLGLVIEPREIGLVSDDVGFAVRDAPSWLGVAGVRIRVFEPAPELVGAIAVLR